MRPTLIVMSHGNMAVEIVKSAKMIVGKIENIYTIPMKESDGLGGIKQKLTNVLELIPNDAQILILVDLLGGTPSNVAMMEKNNHSNLEVVTGVNLPMIIDATFSNATTSCELAHQLLETGQKGVTILQLPKLKDADDDEVEFD